MTRRSLDNFQKAQEEFNKALKKTHVHWQKCQIISKKRNV